MKKIAGIVFLMIVLISTAGCYSNSSETAQTPRTTGNPNSVSIANFEFAPQTLAVSAGTTVTWTNNDSTPHTVTSDTAIFDSGPISPGGNFKFTFTQAGTFKYHCSIHTTMVASVTVQ